MPIPSLVPSILLLHALPPLFSLSSSSLPPHSPPRPSIPSGVSAAAISYLAMGVSFPEVIRSLEGVAHQHPVLWTSCKFLVTLPFTYHLLNGTVRHLVCGGPFGQSPEGRSLGTRRSLTVNLHIHIYAHTRAHARTHAHTHTHTHTHTHCHSTGTQDGGLP